MKKEKPYCGNTKTKAAMMSWIRSLLRRASMKWKPLYSILNDNKRPSQSSNKKLKWEYMCSICHKWWSRKEIEVDHIIPAGSIKDWDDIGSFCKRLFCEREGLRVVCKPCHLIVTKEGTSVNTKIQRGK